MAGQGVATAASSDGATVSHRFASVSKPSSRAFQLLWGACTVSLTDSAVTLRTGSLLQTSLLATLEAVPYAAFGLVAGAVADRIDRRRIMVGFDLASACLLGLVPRWPPAEAGRTLLLLAGIFLVVGGALPDIFTLSRSQLPSAFSPAWTRAAVAVTLGLGTAMVLAVLLRPRRQDRKDLPTAT
jgi:MFS family permease